MKLNCKVKSIILAFCLVIITTSCAPTHKSSKAEVSQARDPLYQVEENGKIGFINMQGAVIIKPQFEDVYFIEPDADWIPVKLAGRWGYIDRHGRMVINPQFDNAYLFREGLAIIHMGNVEGYINTSGMFAINPQYVDAERFVDGLAAVTIQKGKSGFIDKSGNLIIPATFEAASTFSDGLAAICLDIF
jgi:hypothetical protein